MALIEVDYDPEPYEAPPAPVSKLVPVDYDPEPLDPPPASGLLRRAVGDTALSVGQGVVGLGKSAVGLANILTLGRAGKALKEYAGYDPQATTQALEELKTPEQQRANRAVAEAKGFGGTLMALAQNPSVILQKVAETIPLIAGGGAVARTLPAGMTALARGAIGEGALAAGSAAEQTRSQTEGGVLTPEQAALNLTSGAVTGAITRASGGLANKLGVGDIEQLVAGGKLTAEQAAKIGKKGLARRTAEGALTEGVLEEAPQSAQEQALQNIALGRPAGEGVPEATAIGGVLGSVIGAGVGALPQGALPSAAVPPGAVPPAATTPGPVAPDTTQGQPMEPGSPPPSGPIGRALAAAPWQTALGAGVTTTPQEDIDGASRDQEIAAFLRKSEALAQQREKQGEAEKPKPKTAIQLALEQAQGKRYETIQQRQAVDEVAAAPQDRAPLVQQTRQEALSGRKVLETPLTQTRDQHESQTQDEVQAEVQKPVEAFQRADEARAVSTVYSAGERADVGRPADVVYGRRVLDADAHEAATSPRNNLPEPTAQQKEAGNWKKGHVRYAGLDISIENPKGSKRSGISKDGKPWETEMTAAHYGYIKRTEGKNGEQVDAYIASSREDAPAFVVDQIDPKTGKFNEHKAVLGAMTREEAEAVYDAAFSDGSGPSRRQAVTKLPIDGFKSWVREGDTKKPIAGQDVAAAGAPTEVGGMAGAILPATPPRGTAGAVHSTSGIAPQPDIKPAETLAPEAKALIEKAKGKPLPQFDSYARGRLGKERHAELKRSGELVRIWNESNGKAAPDSETTAESPTQGKGSAEIAPPAPSPEAGLPAEERYAKVTRPDSVAEKTGGAVEPAGAAKEGAESGEQKEYPVGAQAVKHFDERLDAPGAQAALSRMAAEASWSQRGGQLLRNENDQVTGRTTWVPKESWFAELPERLNEAASVEAVRKAIAGEKLSAKEGRVIGYMLDAMDREREAGRVEGAVVADEEGDREAREERAALADTALDAISDDDTDTLLSYDTLNDEDIDKFFGGPQEGARGTEEAHAQRTEAGRGAPGAQARPAEGPLLEAYTETGLKRREEARVATERREAEERAARLTKREADEARKKFVLSGSDREADEAAARGQESLFDQPAAAQPPTEKPTTSDGPFYSRATESQGPPFGQAEELFEKPDVAVTRISGVELTAGKALWQLRQMARSRLKTYQKQIFRNADTGWELRVSKDSVGKMSSRTQSADDLRAAAALPALIENAVLAESHNDSGGSVDIAAIHRLYAPLGIAGKLYRVKLTIKEGIEGGRKVYTLTSARIEDPAVIKPATTTLMGGAHERPAGSVLSITDLLRGAMRDSDGRPFEPAPAKYSYAGERGAKTPKHALAAARELAEQGIPMEEIRRTTGWFRGPDAVPEFSGVGVWPKFIKDSSIPEGGVNRFPAYSKLLSDLLESETFMSKGLGGFDIPTQRLVLSVVLSALHNPQIRNDVIKSTPVDVVNDLAARQLTPDVLFNNMPMLADLFTVNTDNTISSFVDVASPIAQAVARSATELFQAGPGAFRSFDPESLPAIVTDNRGSFSTLSKTPQGAKEPAGFTPLNVAPDPVDGKTAYMALDSRHSASEKNVFDDGILTRNIKEVTSRPLPRSGWRYEISDKAARLKLDWDAYDQTVGDALDHPTLFENYPSLAKIGLVFRFDLPANVTGGYAPADNAIHLNQNLTPAGAKSTLLHELQHAVQVIEGFARGGKPTDKGFISAAAAMGIDTNNKDAMVSAYRRLLGEVEARDVQARAGLTAEELRERPPYVEQGIPESEFIVRHEGEFDASIAQGQTVAGLRKNLVKRLGARAIDGLERAGFEIVETEAKIPPELLTTLGWTIRGVHDPKTGKTYLVAGSIPEGTELGILLHEVGVHAGLEGLLGTKLHRALLGNIKAILSPLERAIAAGKSETELNAIRQRIAAQSPLARALVAARSRVPNDTRAGHVVEETLAYLVEDNANRNLTLVKRILGAIRAWLLRHGFRVSELKPEDLVSLAKAAVRSVSRSSEARTSRGTGIDTGLFEAHVNSRLTDAELFGDRSTRQTIRIKGFDALDRKRQQAVLSAMLSVTHDHEIARNIVEAIPIPVVNKLIGSKGTAEDLFHNPSMFKELLSIDREMPVPGAVSRFVEAVAALKTVIAGPTAKQVLPGGVAGRPIEGRATERAGAWDRHAGILPRYAAEGPIFYSEMGRFIDAKALGKTTAAQWKVLLDGWAKAGKFKADELEFSGLKEYLDLQGGVVTKDQVLSYIKSDGVKVEETTLGGAQDRVQKAEQAVMQQAILEQMSDRGAREYALDVARNDLSESQRSLMSDAMKPLASELRDAYALRGSERQEEQTKFAQWQLPGGENYRELLLRLPERNVPLVYPKALTRLPDDYDPIHDTHQREDRQWGITPPGQIHAGPWAGRHATKEAAIEAALNQLNEQRNESAATAWRQANEGSKFRGGHYDEPNVLAHIRFNERTDSEWRRVLFLEEIQSDYAQKGKREGFKGAGNDYFLRKPDGDIGLDFESREEGEQYLRDHPGAGLLDSSHREGIPTAPFVTKTEAWVGLALKRMIRYAAENGFDGIAWTTGEQQADRYDLSKHLDSVSVRKAPSDRGYVVVGKKGNIDVFGSGVVQRDKLADHIGKDLASKALADLDAMEKNPAKTEFNNEYQGVLYQGLDLKVGGQGMRAFYDKIVPNVANGLLKKLGGGRVGTVELEFAGGDSGTGWRVFRPDGTMVANQSTRQNAERYMKEGYRLESPVKVQPSFDLTPELRESAMRGLPLFSRLRDTAVPVPEQVFRWLSVTPGKVFADYEALYRKHPNQFPSAADVKSHVEQVLAQPDYAMPATQERYTLLVRRNGVDKATVIEFELRGGKYRVRSAYTLTPGQFEVKWKQANRRWGGTPRVLARTGGPVSSSRPLTASLDADQPDSRTDTIATGGGQVKGSQGPLYSRVTAATATLPGILDNGNVPPPSPFNEENRRLREEDKTTWDRAKKFWQRNFTPGGLLPEQVFAQKNVRDSELGVVELDTENLVAQLDHAVRQVYGKRMEELRKDQREPLQSALTGKVENIDPRVRTAIDAMRQHVDRLSGEYIAILERQIVDMTASGDPLAEARAGLLRVITGNLGRYVHRSYRAFDDPQWFSKLPNEVIDAAREYLRGRNIEGGMDPAEAADKAERALHTMVKTGTAYDSLESFIREGKLGAKDLSILQRRKDIAPEIRALLGEYDDPRLNYAKSTSKMARLIWNTRFLDRVREIGMGTFLFEEKDAPPGATTKIAADASEVYSPLNGLWTFPEIDQAFQDAVGKDKMADWYRVIVQMNGAVKYGKTILSPTTQIRNFMSSAFFSLANGHFDMKHVAKSIATLRGKSQDYARKLVRLGIVGDSAYAGEVMQLINDSKIEDLLRDKKSTPYLVWRDLNAFAKKAYRNGDDFWKIIGFENEKAALMGVGVSEAQAEREAAERIRNTYPTYSMVGRGIKWLARFPLAGTFVSFPAEIIRTSAHMLRYVAKDYQDPQRRPLAIRRAVGLSMVSGFAYALQAMTMAMMGMDDDEEEAVRRLAAPWQRNSNFLFTGRDERGQLRYFDLSFLDPYNWFKRPITALLRDQPWEDKAAGALRDMLSPFLGTDIAAGALFEVLSNKKETGGPVFNEFAGPVDQSVAIADHLRKALQPGFVGNFERTYKAAHGDRTPSGKKYDLADEGMAWIGWRTTTLEPKTALYYKSFEFSDAKAAAMATLSRTLRSPNEVSREAIASAKANAQRQLSQGYKDMRLIVNAARMNGLSRSDVIRVLRTSGVALRDIPLLLSDREPTLRISPQQIRNASVQARALYGSEKALEIRRRYQETNRPAG